MSRRYTSASRLETLRLIMSIASELGLTRYQWDVTGTFLHAKIDKVIYAKIRTPYGIKYVKVLKACFGLRQSPRVWSKMVREVLEEFGFKRSEFDWALYYLHDKNGLHLLIVHVDDFILLSPKTSDLRRRLSKHFESKLKIKYLGIAKRFIGINVRYDEKKSRYKLDQEDFVL